MRDLTSFVRYEAAILQKRIPKSGPLMTTASLAQYYELILVQLTSTIGCVEPA